MARKQRTAAQKAATRKMIAANRRRRGGGRRRSSGSGRKGRTAAQKAATRKMIAANRRRGGRRRNPAPRKQAAYRSTATMRSPARRRARRVARNPAPPPIVDGIIWPAVPGVGGALAIDLVMGQVAGFLPDALAQGQAYHATKGLLAVAAGWAGRQVVDPLLADRMAVGSLTCTAHAAVREALDQFAPNIASQLDGLSLFVPYGGAASMGYYNAAAPAGGWGAEGNGMGYYVRGGHTSLPAPPTLPERLGTGAGVSGYLDREGYHPGMGEFHENGFNFG